MILYLKKDSKRNIFIHVTMKKLHMKFLGKCHLSPKSYHLKRTRLSTNIMCHIPDSYVGDDSTAVEQGGPDVVNNDGLQSRFILFSLCNIYD